MVRKTKKYLHQTIKKIESDVESLKFNTAISQFMIFTNLSIKKGKVTKETAETFAKILSPFAPHMGEELWKLYGNTESIARINWPAVNEEYLKENTFEYPVSFNGKMRFKIELPTGASKEEVEKGALAHEKAQMWLEGKQVVKVIVVHNKIVNIVIR